MKTENEIRDMIDSFRDQAEDAFLWAEQYSRDGDEAVGNSYYASGRALNEKANLLEYILKG